MRKLASGRCRSRLRILLRKARGIRKRMMRTLTVLAVLAGTLMPLPTRAATGVPIRGTVTSSGSVGAATVTMWVEPDQEYQATAIEEGRTITMRSLETVPVELDGSYSVTLDRTNLEPDEVAADGHVQTWIAVTLGDRIASWGVPVAATDTSIQVPPLDASAGARIPEGQGVIQRTCAINWHNMNGPYNTKVLDVYAQGPVQGRGTYMHGSSTSTTLQFLAKPLSGGNWSVGGSWTDSDRNGTGFLAVVKDKRLHALWRYRERTNTCLMTRQNLPWDYVGKGQEIGLAHVNYGNCGNLYHAGDFYLRTSHANQTYSQGLYVYGIGLNSQSGLSTSMWLKFNFNGSGRVCGNTGQAESAPIVEASVP